jgi:hypothetical protein
MHSGIMEQNRLHYSHRCGYERENSRPMSKCFPRRDTYSLALCASHYRTSLPIILHSGGKMYAEKRCCTCNAWICSRHCPVRMVTHRYTPYRPGLHMCYIHPLDWYMPAFQAETSVSSFELYYSYCPNTNAEQHHMQWYGGPSCPKTALATLCQPSVLYVHGVIHPHSRSPQRS